MYHMKHSTIQRKSFPLRNQMTLEREISFKDIFEVFNHTTFNSFFGEILEYTGIICDRKSRLDSEPFL